MERMMKLQDVLLKAMAKRIRLGRRGRDHRGDGPHHAAMAGATGRARLQRADGSSQGQAQPAAGAVGYRRGGAGVVPEDLLRPERKALSREAERGAWHPVELHL